MHASFFGALVDEFFLATLLRTTPTESLEFVPTVPGRAWATLALWLLACAWAGRTLWRTLPALRGTSLLLRRVWQGAGLFWALVLVYALIQQLNANTFMRKAKSLYPLHVVRAAMRQQEIAAGLFLPPLLPSSAPNASSQVDTIVVVLGESATAHRWSLLGYQGLLPMPRWPACPASPPPPCWPRGGYGGRAALHADGHVGPGQYRPPRTIVSRSGPARGL